MSNEDSFGSLSAVERMQEKQKADAGTEGAFGYLGSLAYLLGQQGGIGAFFSLKSVLLILGGMFVAAVVLGNLFYYSQLGIARALRGFSDRAFVLLSLPWMAVQIAICFFFARLCVQAVY
jgi:hypothetical protein